MEQQLPPPGRLMVLPVAMRVLPDVGVEQPRLVVLHLGKAILELNEAILDGLNLRAGKRQARFKPFEQMEIMPGMPVVAQYLDTRFQFANNGSGANKGSGLDTRLRRSCFLVNARKARRVKRLCGSFRPHLKLSVT